MNTKSADPTQHHYGIADFKDRERIVGVVRHHWFVLLRDVIGVVILFLLPFFLVPLVYALGVAGGTVPAIPGGVVLFFGSLWTLLMWNVLFTRWTDFYYDIWVITNRRIVDIDQQGLFKRNIATLLTLDHIQDLEAELAGVFGNILNFGNLTVQTAAARREFLISEVPDPNGVVKLIRDAQAESKRVWTGVSPTPHA